MRAAFGCQWLAAASTFLIWACAHTSSAAIVRDLPPTATPSRLEVHGDPGLSSGGDSAVPRSAALTTSSTNVSTRAHSVEPAPAGGGAESTALIPGNRVGVITRDGEIGPIPQVIEVAPVPEPSALMLVAVSGLAMLSHRSRRRRR